MRSALYYPHTTIDNLSLIKTSLVLWDKLEFIVPKVDFEAVHGNRHVQRAMEILGKKRVPTNSEKQEAHRLINEIAQGALPSDFYLSEGIKRRRIYEIYPQKFLDKTWELLQEHGLSGDLLQNDDYPMSEPAGLLAMAILADCCAGTTRARITDRGPAYASLANALGKDIDHHVNAARTYQEQLVHISLNVLNPRRIGIDRLIDLREREEKESGHTLRDLRHRYLASLESHIKRLTTEGGRPEDVGEIKREIAEDMRSDFANLKAELGFAKREVFLSKEIVLTSLAAMGSIAAWAFAAPVAVAGTLSVAGAPAALIGTAATANKYAATRRAVMQKHPMAYLYEIRRHDRAWWMSR